MIELIFAVSAFILSLVCCGLWFCAYSLSVKQYRKFLVHDNRLDSLEYTQVEFAKWKELMSKRTPPKETNLQKDLKEYYSKKTILENTVLKDKLNSNDKIVEDVWDTLQKNEPIKDTDIYHGA